MPKRRKRTNAEMEPLAAEILRLAKEGYGMTETAPGRLACTLTSCVWFDDGQA